MSLHLMPWASGPVALTASCVLQQIEQTCWGHELRIAKPSAKAQKLRIMAPNLGVSETGSAKLASGPAAVLFISRDACSDSIAKLCELSHNYRPICCKMGGIAQMCLCEPKYQGGGIVPFWGAVNLPEKGSHDMGCRSDSITISRDMVPLRSIQEPREGNFFFEGGFCKNARLSWLWRSECQMYCWAHYPWVLFVALAVTLDSTETPFAQTLFFGS